MEIDLKKLESIYKQITFGTSKPAIVVVGATSEQGRYILENRNGETDFDGFHHAYIHRGGQTFLVPLYELKES